MVSLSSLQIVFLLFVKLFLQANALGNYTDHLALLKFKQGITSDPHGVLNSWNDSIPFCNWFGITCSPRHHRVTSMMLADQDLVGSISPYIGNLSFLRVIDLINNSIHGGIPHEVGRLFRLQELFLTNNTIDEEVPASIANCSELKKIRLAYNKIAGTIPELGSLQKLEWLSLGNNNLTGKIPSSIGNISTLQIFTFQTNNVEGSLPDSIGRLKNLYILYISSNRLSGVIPPSFFNITSLEVIFVAVNQLRGALPDNICLGLPNIRLFGFGGNRFFGSIPNSLSNCSRLELFEIAQNNFVGKVPTDIGKLRSLYWLNIASNNLGSNSTDDLAFVTSLTNCSNLKFLDISSNNFGGTLPSSIANLSTELTELYMSLSKISGTIPAGIDNLVKLIILSLGGNHLTGSIPSYFGNLQNLQVLSLPQCSFSGEIPSTFGNLTQLVVLYLYDNKLEGNIPLSIGKCQRLTYVDLSFNTLNGSIPPQILLVSSLSISLNLEGNLLSGKLPPELGKLKNLNELNVAENNLSGEIPGTIGECQSMEQLYLQENSFQGTIPSSLASLRGLVELDLSRNNLSGQIPEDLHSLPFLNYLNLSLNFLEGEVPTGGVFRNASALSLYGNSNLCGGIPELNLPKCPSKTINKGKSSHFQITIIIVCVVVLVLFMPTFICLYWRRSIQRKSPPSTTVGEHFTKVSYRDLHRATDGFSAENLIGSGGFSSVYKGSLVQLEKPVAVKVLKLEKKDATKSFKAECRALRNIKHRNLVKIITYCSTIDYKRNEFKALVYEYMGNGSLETWLHSNFAKEGNSGNLSFLQRLNIAIDVASALHYLHDLCEMPIVHCDLKPSNVLLDDDMVAHLSDFGMARLFWTKDDPPLSQSSTIGNKGTVGYAAPEYGIGDVASKEGDVYSYGILLLEMFSGRRPTDEIFKEELNLHAFVNAALSDRLMQIVDPSLLPRDMVVQVAVDLDNDDENGIVSEGINEENYAQMPPNMQKCLLSLFEIGLACSLESPKDRMSMMDITRKLHLIRTDFIALHRRNGRPRTSLPNN